MKNVGELIRKLRKNRGYTLRKVADFLEIDQAVLSKIERGQRKISKEQVVKLAYFFNFSEDELLVAFLSDRIVSQIGDEALAKKALEVAEVKIDYRKFISTDRGDIISKILEVLQKFAGVKKAWIYGSFAREDDNLQSDIDLAVKTDEFFSYFDLVEIQYKIEKVVKRKIDIGFIDAFKSYIYKNIEPDLKCIYERPA